MLTELKAVEVNLETINTDNGYVSLATEILNKPTEQNFKVFQFLVEELGLKVENVLNCRNLDFDTQKDPKDQNEIKKFLDYIDSRTDIKQKNTIQLISLAFFFNYDELFTKLFSDPEISKKNEASRGGTILSDIFMNPGRSVLTAKVINADQVYNEENMGPLKEKYLIQLARYFALLEKSPNVSQVEINNLFDAAINKIKTFESFEKELKEALPDVTLASAEENNLKYLLKFYNLGKINSNNILIDRNFEAILPYQEGEFFGSPAFKLTFFTNLDLLYNLKKTTGNKENINNGKILSFVLEGVKEFKGLDFKMYSNDNQYISVLKSLDDLSDLAISKIAADLDLSSESEIEKYMIDLRQLSNNEFIPGLERVERALQGRMIASEALPGNTGFFTQLLNITINFFKSIFVINSASSSTHQPWDSSTLNFQQLFSADKRGLVLEQLTSNIKDNLIQLKAPEVLLENQPPLKEQPKKTSHVERLGFNTNQLQKDLSQVDKLAAKNSSVAQSLKIT